MNEIFFTVALALTLGPDGSKDPEPKIVEKFFSLEECRGAQPYLQRLHREQSLFWIEEKVRAALKAGDRSDLADMRQNLASRLLVECHQTTYAMPATK